MTVYDEIIEQSALTALRAIDQGESAEVALGKLMAELQTKAPQLEIDS